MTGYDGWKAYQQSKLGDILLPKEFAKRYKGMEAASLHPGGINTNLSRHTGLISGLKFVFTLLPSMMFSNKQLTMKSVEVGASTTVTAATTKDFVNGGYYDDCEVGEESESAKNPEDSKALFDYCDEVTKGYQ